MKLIYCIVRVVLQLVISLFFFHNKQLQDIITYIINNINLVYKQNRTHFAKEINIRQASVTNSYEPPLYPTLYTIPKLKQLNYTTTRNRFFTLFSLSEAKVAALHHYNKSFQGFSAMITPEQASQLAGIYSSVIPFCLYLSHYIGQANILNKRWKTNSIFWERLLDLNGVAPSLQQFGAVYFQVSEW